MHSRCLQLNGLNVTLCHQPDATQAASSWASIIGTGIDSRPVGPMAPRTVSARPPATDTNAPPTDTAASATTATRTLRSGAAEAWARVPRSGPAGIRESAAERSRELRCWEVDMEPESREALEPGLDATGATKPARGGRRPQ